MSIKYTLLALLAFACAHTSVNVMAASSAGLILSSDGPNIRYNRTLIDYPQAWTNPLGQHNQYLSVFVSQESSNRNVLISGALELLKYGKTFSNNHSIAPKAYLFIADLFNHTTTALAAGVTYRIPAQQHPWLALDLAAEAFMAPKILTRNTIDYLWGIDLQATYPLPQNNELTLGYRKYQSAVESRQTAIEQGIYIGLSTYF